MASDDRCELLCLDLPKAESIRDRLDGEDLDVSVAIARALGEPKRLRLALALLAGDALCGCDLAWISGCSEQLVSHHLRALRRAALVTSRRDGKVVLHSLTDAGRRFLAAIQEAEQVAT